ncbi:hypothetical protein V2J09_005586 [Rumex salicifolius]
MGLQGVSLLLGFLGFSLVSLLISPCKGEVYKVGDSDGWTTIGHVDYRRWASTKIFRIGDVVVFNYIPQFHNVMQVNHVAYKACNASFPISTHTSGNDSITINSHGHHFFLCGVPGHCQNGQKLDINVLSSFTPLAPSPSPSSGSTPANKASAFLPPNIINSLSALSATLLLVLEPYTKMSKLIKANYALESSPTNLLQTGWGLQTLSTMVSMGTPLVSGRR